MIQFDGNDHNNNDETYELLLFGSIIQTNLNFIKMNILFFSNYLPIISITRFDDWAKRFAQLPRPVICFEITIQLFLKRDSSSLIYPEIGDSSGYMIRIKHYLVMMELISTSDNAIWESYVRINMYVQLYMVLCTYK